MNNGTHSFDWVHRKVDGTEFPSTVLLSRLNGGEHLYQATVRDITESKRIGEALRESEEKFRDIFDYANDAIHVREITESGAPGRFIDINEVACRMLGYTHEEMLMMEPLDIATKYHDPPLEKILNDLRTIGRARFETGHRRKDGTIVPVEVNSHVVNHLGKKIAIGVVRDITESKHNVDALKLANKKLNLLSSISRHDLINQLTPLMGYLALMERGGVAPSSESYFKKAMASAERISMMVQFTKEYENIGVNAPIWQDIGSLIENAIKEVQTNNVSIVNEIAAGTEIYADPLIQKVFFNLIDNAMRHGEHISTIRFFRPTADGLNRESVVSGGQYGILPVDLVSESEDTTRVFGGGERGQDAEGGGG